MAPKAAYPPQPTNKPFEEESEHSDDGSAIDPGPYSDDEESDSSDDEPPPFDPYELERKLFAVKLQQDAEATAAAAKEMAKASHHNTSASTDQSKGNLLPYTYHSKSHSTDAQSSKDKKPTQDQSSHPMTENRRPPLHHRGHAGYHKALAEHNGSPDSQVIESGDCSPGSEEVKRADRKDVFHWPGSGINDSSKR